MVPNSAGARHVFAAGRFRRAGRLILDLGR